MLKPIPDFPDYFASDDGEIYSMKPRRYCSPIPKEPRKRKKICEMGRYWVVLRVGDKRHKCTVARLMLLAFVSPRPKDMYACHGVKGSLVDTLDNLYWGTLKRNCQDKWRDGTMPAGEKSPHAKLNNLQVRIIKRCHEINHEFNTQIFSLNYLARTFNVSKKVIFNIKTGKSWKHIIQ